MSFLTDNFLTLAVLMGLVYGFYRLFCPEKPGRPKQLFWVALAAAVVQVGAKFVIPLFRRRKYTSGTYALGEIYRRMVLRENINTRDDRVVGDEAAYLAMYIFTAGFGIVCSAADHYDAIVRNDMAAYNNNLGKFGFKATPAQWARATGLAQLYFKNKNSPVPESMYWNLANFGTVALVAPIPDPQDVKTLMNVELPNGLLVKNGWPVEAADPAKTQAVQTAMSTQAAAEEKTAGFGMAGMLAVGALAVGYFMYGKKQHK